MAETEIKKEFSKGRGSGMQGFKKKGGRKFTKQQASMGDYLKQKAVLNMLK